MNKLKLLIVLVLATSLAACASIEPKPGFDDVSQQISSRVGKNIHWRKGGPEDEQVVQKIRAMLQNEVTADVAVQIALLNNPRLQATYEELGVAQADLVQAGLLRNPVFEGAVLYPRGESGKAYDFDISWDFLGVFTLPLRKAAAERDFEAAKLRVTNEVMALSAEVRSTFYQTQANKQFVEMLQQVVDATGTGLQVAERLRKAGNITELALDQRRVMHQESRLALASAEAAFMDSRERLNAMMGVWGTATRWTMNTRLPEIPATEIDVSAIEKQAIERNLELDMLRLQMEALAKRAGIVNVTSVIPDLEIGYIWERSDEGDWEDGPSISFPIPIFDFGQAKRAKARAQLEQVRNRYKALAIKIRSTARGVARDLEMARMRERHLREVMLPLRQRIIQGLMLEYNAMQIGVFRLLQAQEQQLLTGQRYIESLREYWLARAGVELIVNGHMAEGGGGMAMAVPAAASSGSEGGH